MIAAGQLRHRITVEAFTETPRADGGIDEAWTNVGQRWASIEPLNGKEFMEAQQLGSEVTHRVKLRHFPGLTPKHRLTFGTRTFNIVSVLNLDERSIVAELMCKEDVT